MGILNFRWWLGIVLLGLATACATDGKSNGSDPAASDEAPPPMEDEVSLSADRSQLAELRKDIEVEKKRDNDELAFILGMLKENEGERPDKIRNRFDTFMRKYRDKRDKAFRKSREEFSKSEKRKRDEFLRSHKEQRDEALKKKMSREQRKSFFDDQDTARKEYMASERERRQEFEATQTQARRDGEDFIRERRSFFEGELNSYRRRFDERKKAEELKRRMQDKRNDMELKKLKQESNPASSSAHDSEWESTMDSYKNDFNAIPPGSGSSLGD